MKSARYPLQTGECVRRSKGEKVHSPHHQRRGQHESKAQLQQRAAKLVQDAHEPAFSLFSPEAKRFPLILTLDQNGVPHRWITWQHAVWYYAKERIAWELGSEAFTVSGGKCRETGEVSTVTAASIIAIRGKAMAIKGFNQTPPLNNRELFHRDRHICAYCGGLFSHARLTRDHIIPYSRNGIDTWMNVVTSCRGCNERKGNRLLEEAHMQLLYAPYVPNRAEFLILANRRILADQMEFLKQHCAAQSRIHLPEMAS
jgi:5-methylcytosine-specific restriction endonuclease McrA